MIHIPSTILIVDDVEINRSILADILSDYDILEADNGVSAVDIMRKNRENISLVLLDVAMPEMDGFQVLEIMNKEGIIKEIPVVLISADDSEKVIAHAYDLGAADYIRRPFNVRIIERRIKNTMLIYEREEQLKKVINKKLSDCQTDKAEVEQLREEYDLLDKVSSRTLELLEQERTKYKFFASMSNEIQFEYDKKTDVLSISEWGANKLGIDEVIPSPMHNSDVEKLLSSKDLNDIFQKIERATKSEPVVKANYSIHTCDAERWYKVVARPIWESEDSDQITKIIGKLTDDHDQYTNMARLKLIVGKDSLTGLLNQKAGREAVEEILNINSEHDLNKKFIMMVLDIDGIKELNKKYGHLFGDEAVRYIGKKISEHINEKDVALRCGGDQCLVFCEYKDSPSSIVNNMQSIACGSYKNHDISSSIGVALFPEHGRNYIDLFEAANKALYTAKAIGKGECCYYDDFMK